MSAVSNYPDGIQEGDPRMPWNQPDEEWREHYCALRDDLLDPASLAVWPDDVEEAVASLRGLADRLMEESDLMERLYAADCR